jgi:acetylornithine deacetylase/succinyl-diaminopimelate desuccinylase-like protein
VEKAFESISRSFDATVIPTLEEYVRIPNQSPSFDAEWATNGYMDQAVTLLSNWAKNQNIPGFRLEEVRLEKRTPVIFIEVDSSKDFKNKEETVLLYGHLDKQPPLTEAWSEGLGPYTPVIKNGRLYGRGGADDGYAIFSSLLAIKVLQEQGLPHARYVVIIEACEESGSPDLPAYVDHLKDRIGIPSLVICLDSGAGNYEQMWLTTSLRGVISGPLTVEILKEGMHSGSASGIIPSSFRIIRQLLSRIEDENTGKVLVPELYAEVPTHRIQQVKETSQILGDLIYREFPFVEGARPMSDDHEELLLNKTWRPTVSYTGAEGFPTILSGGNVLRTRTSLKLSIRLPPTVKVDVAIKALKHVLEKDPPYGACVRFEAAGATGWESPALVPWLAEAARESSLAFFKKEIAFTGEGGTIPFMGMLGEKFPEAQFVITGVLGPQSNAHGPNEFLDIAFTKKITGCIAFILHKHASLSNQ